MKLSYSPSARQSRQHPPVRHAFAQAKRFAWTVGTMATATTTERLARYEAAQEIIGMMVALRAAWISAEQQNAVPDRAKIQAWEAEQTRFTSERTQLRLEDEAAIARVLSVYAPVVRAALAA